MGRTSLERGKLKVGVALESSKHEFEVNFLTKMFALSTDVDATEPSGWKRGENEELLKFRVICFASDQNER